MCRRSVQRAASCIDGMACRERDEVGCTVEPLDDPQVSKTHGSRVGCHLQANAHTSGMIAFLRSARQDLRA